MGVCSSQIEVRYAETDQMGVVHHSHYPVYFEQGRTEYFQQFLKPYQEFEADGLMAPVLSYEVRLKGQLGYGDVLRLETRCATLKGLRIIMKYKGYNQSNLVVEGQTVHAVTGLDLVPLHPRSLPPSYDFLKERLTTLLEPEG